MKKNRETLSKDAKRGGKRVGNDFAEEMTKSALARFKRNRKMLADAMGRQDFSAFRKSGEDLDVAFERVNRTIDRMARGYEDVNGKIHKSTRLSKEQERSIRESARLAFDHARAQERILRGAQAQVEHEESLQKNLKEMWAQREKWQKDADRAASVAARRRTTEANRVARVTETSHRQIETSVIKMRDSIEKNLDGLDRKTASWSRVHRRHIRSAISDWNDLNTRIKSMPLSRQIVEVDKFAKRIENLSVRTGAASRIMGRNLDNTFRGRWRIAMRDAGRETTFLRRTVMRLTSAIRAVKIPNLREMTSRMDSTVRAVLILIAAGAEHMATLGSGIASAATAIASSLVFALGTAIPLAAGLSAALLGVGLAVTAWKNMDELMPSIKSSLEELSSAWQGQAATFASAWEPALAGFLDAVTKLLEVQDFGQALGDSLASVTQAFTDVVNGSGMSNFLEALSGPLSAGLTGFGTGLASLTDGLLNLLAAAAPGFERLGGMFQAWGDRFSESMQRMSDDGTIASFTDRAIDAFQDVMGVLGPLGSALGNVFNVGEESGGRLLERLGNIMERFDSWSGSLVGQNALADWFQRGEEVMSGLGDLLGGLGEALAGLVDEGTTKRLGDFLSGLGEFAPVLGDILRTVSNLDLLGNLVDLLNVLGEAAAPLMPILQNLTAMIGDSLATAISTLSPLLNSIGEMLAPIFGAAAEVIGALLPPIMEIIGAVSAGLVPVFDALTSALEPLMPVIVDIAETLGGILSEAITLIAPLFVSLVEAVTPIIAVLGELLGAILPLIAPALTAIMSALTPVIELLVGMLGPALEFIGGLLAQVIGWLVPIVTFVVEQVIGNIVGAVEGLSAFITNVVDTVKKLFSGDFAGAWESAKAAVDGAVQFIWNAVQLFFIGKLVKGIAVALKSIGTFFANSWSTITSGVGRFFSGLLSKATGAMSSVGTNISTRLASIRTFFSNTWNTITTGISNFVSGLVSKITTGVSNVVTKVKELPGKITAGLGNLLAKGREIAGNFITGMVNGIVNGASRVVTAATNMAKNAWNAVTNFLGISSPSKLMATVGRWFDVGFERGIVDHMKGPESAAQMMAERAADAVDMGLMNQAGRNAAEAFGAGLENGRIADLTPGFGSLSGSSGSVRPVDYDPPTPPPAGMSRGSTVFEPGSVVLATPATDPEVLAEQLMPIIAEKMDDKDYS